MRELHSLIASRVSRKAKIEAPLRPQGRVDTSPVAVHSRFRRQFHSFDQKRPNGGHVDIFPPYNIKATDVHNPGGGSSESRERDMLKLIPSLAHWGEPFHCPRQRVRYGSGRCVLHPKVSRGMSNVEGRREWKAKATDRRRGKSKVGGILKEAVGTR